MELQTSIDHAIVSPLGKSATDRKAHAVTLATSQAALAAIASIGGKVGKAAGARLARMSHVDIVNHCANSNYRPLAEYLAALTGETVIVDRHVFHALPSTWAAKVDTLINAGKEFNAAGKTTPAMSLARQVHAYVSELVRASEAIRMEREADKRRTDEIKRLMDLADQVDASVDADATLEELAANAGALAAAVGEMSVAAH